jgi:hypothetical protein
VANQFLAVAVGIGVFAIGVAFLIAHVRSWRLQRHDPALSQADLERYYRRYRRRMQTSGMIAALGVLLAVGDQLPILQRRPLLAGLYWTAVLALVGWVTLLGMADLLATRAHSRIALSEVRQKQRELENQIEEIRRSRANGHGAADQSRDTGRIG